MRRVLVVAFTDRAGRTKVGKVAKWGRQGAEIITKGGTAFQVPWCQMKALDVALVKSHGRRVAILPGGHIRSRSGGVVHEGIVESVTGDEAIVRPTSERGRGHFAHEIIEVVDREQ
jgi:hypothetical protein